MTFITMSSIEETWALNRERSFFAIFIWDLDFVCPIVYPWPYKGIGGLDK